MKRDYFIIQAIQALVPKRTNWILEENNSITWGDNGPNFIPPTIEQINQKASELESEYLQATYQRDRVKAYPSIGDQLDMLYHDIKNGTLNSGAWIQAIEDIKSQYPKPTE